ncbi:hypothetical protein GGF31_008230 [Allomyces arbusculus]|nr:hypothetical protein GGF31_008230 [Allomyces arbusculus]
MTVPDTVPLIPLATFFGNPDRGSPRISPDGTHLAYLAPGPAKNLQVHVQSLDAFRAGDEPATQVTHHKSHDIRFFQWTRAGNILFLQDTDGDEDFHLYHVDLVTGETRDLTPFAGVTVWRDSIEGKAVFESSSYPGFGLFALNKEDAKHHDIYKVEYATGELDLHAVLPERADSAVIDKDLNVRAAKVANLDGSSSLLVRVSNNDEWVVAKDAGVLDEIGLVGMAGESTLLVAHSVGFDTVVLASIDLASLEETVLAERATDIQDVKVHNATDAVLAVMNDPGRATWTVQDEQAEPHFDAILAAAAELDADVQILNATSDDAMWTLALVAGDAPARYYLYHKTTQELEFLFGANAALADVPLGKVESVNYAARDGLPQQGYLTFPPYAETDGTAQYPLVLYVHGGPWARDHYGYAQIPQWLANRGYLVLQPNYRGSTGFNKRHLTAGFKEWGRAMHTDLLDAVEYAVERGLVDREHVAIVGGSYGGYAALAGVTLTPEYFTCAVDIVGPSNLKTLLATIPPYWEAFLSSFHTRMGHPEHDSDLLDAVSPLFHADKIVRPLLISQGANDPRVKQSESEQIVAAIEAHGGSVTYVLYPDEGHGWSSPTNRIDFFSKAEVFLAQWMGSEVRVTEGLTVDGNVEGASAIVRVVGE